MSPKDKAKQLIDEMQFCVIERNGVLYSGIKKDVAKEAAKIVIQNILLHNKNIDTVQFSIYWGSVMNEIDNI